MSKPRIHHPLCDKDGKVWTCFRLKTELLAAIKSENYELAADIRTEQERRKQNNITVRYSSCCDISPDPVSNNCENYESTPDHEGVCHIKALMTQADFERHAPSINALSGDKLYIYYLCIKFGFPADVAFKATEMVYDMATTSCLPPINLIQMFPNFQKLIALKNSGE